VPTRTTGTPDLITPTERGLWCEAGGFHIDPWKPVERAVVTHAHADHACPGCAHYLASPATCDLLRVRIGPSIDATPLPFGTPIVQGAARVSLHPAGHILGSAQVRVEDTRLGDNDGTWCVSGDYKTDHDPTAERFEPVRCDTFISETTFALPIYRWPDRAVVASDINRWWRGNARAGRTSVLLAYSLGKAQRVLRMLDPSIGPIGVHASIPKLSAVYDQHGVVLPDALTANPESAPDLKNGAVIVAPPAAASGPWIRRFAGPEGLRVAMVSGWMRVRGRRRWQSVDHGFVLSDHADWQGLLDTIDATGAARVGLTHGSASVMARYLNEQTSLDAFVIPTRYTGEEAGEPEQQGPEQPDSGSNDAPLSEPAPAAGGIETGERADNAEGGA
jgi:putative mRNA 3-end processing factor